MSCDDACGRGWVRHLLRSLVVAAALAPGIALSAPACVNPEANNFVVARGPGDLTEGWGGQWLLQNVATSERIFLRHCGTRKEERSCYYAVDVTPGKYYFQQVMPEGKNSMQYPVTRDRLWFEVTGKGVDYIGDWTIERDSDRLIKRLEVRYSTRHLDEMLVLCRISGKKAFLSRTRQAASEIVD